MRNMSKNLLFLLAVSGTAKEKSLVLPRMNYIPGKDEFPLPGFKRCQFPVRASFAMTMNKAQGQSVPSKLGIYLSSPSFAHGQLYVALSRATHPGNIYVFNNDDKRKTKNLVYPEALSVVKDPLRARNKHVSKKNAPIATVSLSRSKRVPEIIRLDDDVEFCSEYDPIESRPKVCDDRKRERDSIDTIELRDRAPNVRHQSISYFESYH